MYFEKYKYIDTATLAIYLLGLFFVMVNHNTYEDRVFFVSLGVASFSALIALYAVKAEKVESYLGWMLILAFSIPNSSVSVFRMLASKAQVETQFFNLAALDTVFFIWSIAGVFLFSIGQFVNGNAVLRKVDCHKMAVINSLLEKEKYLSQQLSTALEDQRNLQKLLLHEFKRPITSINAILQTGAQRSDTLTKDKVARLKVLSDQSVKFLKDFSEYENITHLFEHPNFDDLPLASVISDLQKKWCVKVVVKKCDKDCVLWADYLLLDIALGNLIENAQKFCLEPKNIKVFVTCDDAAITFDIHDDGPGIPEAEWLRVWDKFYKSDDISSSVLHGCGLGLYIVAKIATAHSGSAYVVSQSPSVMRFQIPRHIVRDTHV